MSMNSTSVSVVSSWTGRPLACGFTDSLSTRSMLVRVSVLVQVREGVRVRGRVATGMCLWIRLDSKSSACGNIEDDFVVGSMCTCINTRGSSLDWASIGV